MVYDRGKGFGKSLQAKAINMKEAIKPIKKMAMGSSHGQVETSIKGTTMKIWEVGTEKCIGKMEVSIKANGLREYNMERARFMFPGKAIKKDYLKIMFWSF